MASPIPAPPPVTMATLSFRRIYPPQYSSAASQIGLFHRQHDRLQHIDVLREGCHECRRFGDLFHSHHGLGGIPGGPQDGPRFLGRSLHAHVSRMQTAGRYTVVAPFQSCNDCQPPYTEFARGIRRRVKSWTLGGDAANVEDSPATLTLHDPHCRARAEKRPPEIRSHYFVPSLRGKFVQGAAIGGTGIVNKDVEPM